MKKIVALVSLLVIFTAYAYFTSYEYKSYALFKDVKEKFEKMKGEKLDAELKIVDESWVLERWGDVEDEFEREKEVFYKALMLVPADFNFSERRCHELSSFMAFFWDGDVYVVKENFDPENGEALAHELAHVYQSKFDVALDGSQDHEKAYAAVIEGDAVLTGWMYANKNVSKELERVKREASCENDHINLNDSLDFLFRFPYIFGTIYVGEMYLKGYDTRELLRYPPKTTAEIIYGFKSNDLSNKRLGALFLYVFLATHLDDCLAFEVAKGWRNDEFDLKLMEENFEIEWKLYFKSEKDAERFLEAFENMMKNFTKEDGWKVEAFGCSEKILLEIKNDVVEIQILGVC